MSLTIVNFHVPKTAGSTFLYRLRESLMLVGKEEAIHNVTQRATQMQGEHWARLRNAFEADQEQAEGEDLSVLSGHFRYRDVGNLLAPQLDETLLMTFLRHPVARVLSDFYYSSSPAHDETETFRKRYPTLESYLEEPEQMNKQAGFLAPGDGATIEDTIEHVREKFGFVGCTERFDSDFERLMGALRIPASEPARRNESPNPKAKSEAEEKYRDMIHDLTADDRKLYDAFCGDGKLFEPRVPTSARKRRSETDETELLSRMEKLGPWHHKIHLTGDVWTGTGRVTAQTPKKGNFSEPLKAMQNQTRRFLPDGFKGRRVLDCGCNAGGYSFAARDLGASRVLGIDAREHWIKQADFIKQNRDRKSDGVDFRMADVMDLSFLEEEFEVTWFSGLLHLLRDPMTGLRNAAEHTTELFFINTSVFPIAPDANEVPALHMQKRNTEELTSAIYPLGWTPSGPKAVKGMLSSLGFEETRIIFWNKQVQKGEGLTPGRLCMVGAREAGRLDGIPNAKPNDHRTGQD